MRIKNSEQSLFDASSYSISIPFRCHTPSLTPKSIPQVCHSYFCVKKDWKNKTYIGIPPPRQVSISIYSLFFAFPFLNLSNSQQFVFMFSWNKKGFFFLFLEPLSPFFWKKKKRKRISFELIDFVRGGVFFLRVFYFHVVSGMKMVVQ